MKLKVDRYRSQLSIGLTYTYINGIYKSIVLDLIFFYIELVIKDYPKNEKWFYE
jgi:hypothetical protein